MRHKIIVSSDVLGVENITLDVVLQIGNAKLSANAGVQYVVIFKENAEADEKGEIKGIAGTSGLLANKGKYTYRVEGLPKGRYTMLTGSDLDLDDKICDEGESCGQYPTLSKLEVLTISEENVDLDIDMTVN